MPGPEMDFKRELFEAGSQLLSPPGSVDELLILLDRVEHCLSLVAQQPPVGMQDALCPSFKALIADKLLRHPDIDVRVGVTACLTEISRITAPDVPYTDDVMKEVFKLTISAFEGLSDISSKSFSKRVYILETVARVRSCAVLLDLECDALVVEMFQNFYKGIRDFHPDIVFACMESIMTLVIEENEEISMDLLFSLLSILKKDNKDALPIARKLGEKVVQNCANKLKNCIVEALRSLNINLLDYDFVVTLACQIPTDHNPLEESILSVPLVNGSESTVQAAEDLAQAVAGEAVPSLTRPLPSNGLVEVVEDATRGMLLNDSDITHSNVDVRPGETDVDHVQPAQDAPGSEIAKNPLPLPLSRAEPKSEKIAKKRGRKPKISKDLMQTDFSKLHRTDGNKESLDVNTRTKLHEAPPKDSYDSTNIVVENKATSLGSPSLTDILLGKSTSKRIRRSKVATSTREETPSHPDTPSLQISEKDASDGLNNTETRLVSSEQDTPDGALGVASKLVSLVEVKKEQDIEGGARDNMLKQSGPQLGAIDETPRTKKRGRPRKDAFMSPSTGVKDRVSSEGTSKKRRRRRFVQPEDGKEYGEELVGSRIKVWWPQDKEYYSGIVESFDSAKKKHKILYSDNEREVLNLLKEKWKILKSVPGSEKDGVACDTNPGDGSDIPQLKKLKTGSDSAGTLGNTDSPPKRRRGRPPKNSPGLAKNDSVVKCSGKPEGEIKSDKSKIDSMADAGSHAKSLDSVAKGGTVPNLNVEFKNFEEVPESDSTHAKQDSTGVTGIMGAISPNAAALGFDINETFTLGKNESPDLNETATATPEGGDSEVTVTEEVKSDPSAGSKTEGANQKVSASGTGINPRKRKARTSSSSSSTAVPISAGDSIKRRHGRRSRLSRETSDGNSIDLSKQLGDPRVDDSSRDGNSDSVAVVTPEDSLVEGEHVSFMSAEHNVPEHGSVDNNASKSAPNSMTMGIKQDVPLAQDSSKSTTEELNSCSYPVLKLKSKTSDSEPKLRRRAVKITSSPDKQVNKDGCIKKSRGRPCKPKVEDPKSGSKSEGSRKQRAVWQHDDVGAAKHDAEVINRTKASLENSSCHDTPNMRSSYPKNPIPADVDMRDHPEIADNTNTTCETGSLKQGLSTRTKDVGASEKAPTTIGSPKEQLIEVQEKLETKRSRKYLGGEVFFS